MISSLLMVNLGTGISCLGGLPVSSFIICQVALMSLLCLVNLSK